MKRKVHCINCGCEIDKDIDVKVGNRWRCKNCDDKVKKETNNRNELYEYISKLYNIKFPTGLIIKQIKTFKEEYGYKYSGMLLSLKYFYETLQKPLKYDDGVGIIPYIYEDAKKNYLEQRNIKKEVEHMGKLSDNKVIQINKTSNKNHDNKDMMIDISKIK